ncbi:hypothetical protein [Vibrio cyclitrophicus]|uniref:hypothetical protein n=1 Tax=Vibrio cyclitrophicus TaxID=47951 RepID=UPI00029B0880|nr:hypothetical protein [Vibrio cyclitrophicus]OEE21746.1 hypothetical protein OAM_21125 [Vibrio cyclitrophicus ZF14]
MSAIATYIICVIGICVGLYLPDVDLVLMSILHHRSMLTHSVILPMFLLFHKSSRPLVAGLCIGVSIHLLADILSPMRGFALIYIPFIKKSIGDWQSIVWMVGNALVGLWYAKKVFHKYAVALLFAVSGLWYAVYNEQSLFAFLPCLAVLVGFYFFDYKKSSSIE